MSYNFSFRTYFVGNRYLYKGKIAKCIAETDSGNVKLQVGSNEVWASCSDLVNLDGATRGFKVFELPQAA